MTVLHTSRDAAGQIYMPQVNALLMIAVVLLVIGFGSSSDLGARLRHRGDRRDAGDGDAAGRRDVADVEVAACG